MPTKTSSTPFTVVVLAALLLMGFASTVNAEVKLHPIFTDNMVLQRDKPIVVWGTAIPGEKVMVTLVPNYDPRILPIIRIKEPELFITTADTNGRWKTTFKAQSISTWILSHTLRVTSQAENGKSIYLKNIVIGDVYICSGQSNMEWPVNASNNAQAEIEAANFPNIRLLTIPKKVAATPQKEFADHASWQVCSPESVGEFSAVAYYFGRELNQTTGIPIGLIDATWGGTYAEAWTSREALASLGEPYRDSLTSFDEFVAEQTSALKEGQALRLRKPNQPAVLFNSMIAPLLSFPVRGAIWYQGENNADNPVAYRTLFPALIRDWRKQWNAKQDGSEFGFYFVQLANYQGRKDQPIQEDWAALREAQALALSFSRTGMAVAIDIGEANDIHPRNKQDVGKRLALAALAKEYGQDVEYSGPVFEAMKIEGNKARIEFSHSKGLRAKDASDVALAESQKNVGIPLDFWGYAAKDKLEEAFGFNSYPLGKTLMTRYDFAVFITRLTSPFPNGEEPRKLLNPEMQDLLSAFEQEFEPELQQLKTRGGGLTLRDANSVNGFAIRGGDGRWYLANARIDGETVVVWSDEIAKPKAVSYAWANNPDVNLINAADLPAVPFRADVQ